MKPIVAPEGISPLCIQENDRAWSKEFLPMLQKKFAQHGIPTVVYPVMPSTCRYRLNYNVNWTWDVALYLEYADISVYDQNKMIGEITYDARSGYGTFKKFGSTEGKLEPLIDDLLQTVPPAAEVGSRQAPTAAEQLENLDQLREKGLVSDQEYRERRTAILKGL